MENRKVFFGGAPRPSLIKREKESVFGGGWSGLVNGAQWLRIYIPTESNRRECGRKRRETPKVREQIKTKYTKYI